MAEWVCEFCTFLNHESLAAKCEICDSQRSSAGGQSQDRLSKDLELFMEVTDSSADTARFYIREATNQGHDVQGAIGEWPPPPVNIPSSIAFALCS
jgi:hypothetical protein